MPRFNLTQTWQLIASAGTVCDVQNISSVGVLILTSSTVPAPGLDGELLFGPAPFRQLNLTMDLYARSATSTGAIVEVLTGLAAATGGGGSTQAAPVPAKAFADRSGATSANTGSFTQLSPPNAARVYLRIMNTSSSGTLYVWDKVGTPYIAGSMPVQPGSEREFTVRVSNTAIMVAGSIASISFESAEA